MSSSQSSERPQKHLAFLVEIPAMYTADLDELREFDFPDETRTPEERESDFLLNCCGEPSVVRLRMECSGEKDSEVVEVWGSIRRAELVDSSRGYGDGPHLTDEQLAENGFRLVPDPADQPSPEPSPLRGKKTFKVENGRNKHGLVCLDCGATWLAGEIEPDHVHLNDDWNRCGPRWLEVTGV